MRARDVLAPPATTRSPAAARASARPRTAQRRRGRAACVGAVAGRARSRVEVGARHHRDRGCDGAVSPAMSTAYACRWCWPPRPNTSPKIETVPSSIPKTMSPDEARKDAANRSRKEVIARKVKAAKLVRRRDACTDLHRRPCTGLATVHRRVPPTVSSIKSGFATLPPPWHGVVQWIRESGRVGQQRLQCLHRLREPQDALSNFHSSAGTTCNAEHSSATLAAALAAGGLTVACAGGRRTRSRWASCIRCPARWRSPRHR